MKWKTQSVPMLSVVSFGKQNITLMPLSNTYGYAINLVLNLAFNMSCAGRSVWNEWTNAKTSATKHLPQCRVISFLIINVALVAHYIKLILFFKFLACCLGHLIKDGKYSAVMRSSAVVITEAWHAEHNKMQFYSKNPH